MKRFVERSKSPKEAPEGVPEEELPPREVGPPKMERPPAFMPESIRVNDRNFVYAQHDVVRLVGKQRGPDGKYGTYALADGKSGDIKKFPLPNPNDANFDPSNPKAVFFPFDTRAELKSGGPFAYLVKATDQKGKEGLWHVPKESVYQPPHKQRKYLGPKNAAYFAKRAMIFAAPPPQKRGRGR